MKVGFVVIGCCILVLSGYAVGYKEGANDVALPAYEQGYADAEEDAYSSGYEAGLMVCLYNEEEA